MRRPSARPPAPVATVAGLIEAAREAWAQWGTAEEDQFERVLLIGKAMLAGRIAVMKEVGASAPLGYRYNTAMGEWRARWGFGDMPARWCCDATWIAENEAVVRDYWTAATAARASGSPSAHPSTLRLNTIKARTNGPPPRPMPRPRGPAGRAPAQPGCDGTIRSDRVCGRACRDTRGADPRRGRTARR